MSRQLVRAARTLAMALVLAGCAATAAAATGRPPRVVTPGIVKAYADIRPVVHLFGDTIHASLSVVADRRLVDPARLRVSAEFAPYRPVTPPQVLTERAGRFEQLTWMWTLRCLSARCVPVIPPSEKFHVFRFPPVRIRYLRPGGTVAFRLAAAWPRIEVLSQLSPSVVNNVLHEKYDWQYSLAPVAAPTFRVRPLLLFWLAIGAAVALVIGALALAARWYLATRPRRTRVPVFQGTPLERALRLLTWAHAHGDEILERKAFERIADELDVVPAKDALSETAHALAWQPRLPDDAEIQAFVQRAREAEQGTIG